jgi:hypothetical protein
MSEAASRFHLQPDPPVAGQALVVTYVGPATVVEWQVDGQAPRKVKPDAHGRFTIPNVPAGVELMLSDRRGLPGYLHRFILHLV